MPKIFISWSGARSRAVAAAINPFMAGVLGLEGFFSEDINVGNWAQKVRAGLQDAAAGLVVVTPESLASKWLWMEVGAMFMKEIPVFPILFGATVDSLPRPLSDWQATTVAPGQCKDAVFSLLSGINREMMLSPAPIDNNFRELWSEHGDRFDNALAMTPIEDGNGEAGCVGSLRAYYPDPASGLWKLIESMEGPAYVCDEQCRILVANKAAELLFRLRLDPCHPKPLRELIEEKEPIMINGAAVMKNFKLHFALNDVPPVFHAEDIIFDHNAYGRVELRKIGQEYRDPVLPGQGGWVVSFNIVHIADSKRYWSDLQTAMMPDGLVQRLDDGTWLVLPKVANASSSHRPAEPWSALWNESLEYADFRVVLAPPDDKSVCQEFAFEMMQRDEHGLADLEAVKAEYDELSRSEFVVAYDSHSDSPASVCRIRPGYDVLQHKELVDEARAFVSGGRLMADIGAYSRLPPLVAAEAFKGMFILCIRLLYRTGGEGVYIQSRADAAQLRFFKKLGFVDAGRTFQHPAWRHRWTPMILKIRDVHRGSLDKAFPKEWKAKYGVPLNVSLWNDV